MRIVGEVPGLQVDAQEVAHAMEGVRLRRRLPPTHAVALALEAHELERGRGGVVAAACAARRLDECARLREGHVDVVLAVNHEERRLQQIMDELAQVCTRVSKTRARVDVRTQRS